MTQARKILASCEVAETKIELRDDGIIQFFYGNIEYTMKEARLLEAAVAKLTDGVTRMSLRVADRNSSMDVEVMKYLSTGRGTLFTLADAFVIHSVTQKVLANFYLHIIRPVLPTRVFTNYVDAETWLLSLDQEDLHRRHKLKILQLEK